MHAHSLTRGVGARITRLYLKWLPGSAQAFLQKHDRGDLGNAMMSLVNLDGSRLQRGGKDERGGFDELHSYQEKKSPNFYYIVVLDLCFSLISSPVF